MLNSSMDGDDSGSEEEEDSDADSEDESTKYVVDDDSDGSSESEEEEDEEEGQKRRTHNRPTRKFGAFGRPNMTRSASTASKKYNSISWPEKITAVMLKYGGGQGRAGDICKWIQAEYFDDIDDSKNWKNTVSAFLSNNKRFIKGDPQGPSRAAVWRLSNALEDGTDSSNGDISRKRRRPVPAPITNEASGRNGAVTRAAAGAPPAKRRKFASDEPLKSRHSDSSEDEEEEHQDGDSDHFDEAEERKASVSKRPNGARAPATKPKKEAVVTPPGGYPSPSSSGTGSPIENASKTANKPQKMWPDRIEDVLLKHGGQGMAHEIHRWIEEDFMEDTVGRPGWKNLVSAHLSSNKKFVREQRAGKQGGVWILRSMLHQTSERRQPVALLSRNSPSPSNGPVSPQPQQQQRLLPSVHSTSGGGTTSPTTTPPSSANRSPTGPVIDGDDKPESPTTTSTTTTTSSISTRRRSKQRD